MKDWRTLESILAKQEADIHRMFFTEHFNTAKIARKMKLREWVVDNLLARELDRRYAEKKQLKTGVCDEH